MININFNNYDEWINGCLDQIASAERGNYSLLKTKWEFEMRNYTRVQYAVTCLTWLISLPVKFFSQAGREEVIDYIHHRVSQFFPSLKQSYYLKQAITVMWLASHRLDFHKGLELAPEDFDLSHRLTSLNSRDLFRYQRRVNAGNTEPLTESERRGMQIVELGRVREANGFERKLQLALERFKTLFDFNAIDSNHLTLNKINASKLPGHVSRTTVQILRLNKNSPYYCPALFNEILHAKLASPQQEIKMPGIYVNEADFHKWKAALERGKIISVHPNTLFNISPKNYFLLIQLLERNQIPREDMIKFIDTSLFSQNDLKEKIFKQLVSNQTAYQLPHLDGSAIDFFKYLNSRQDAYSLQTPSPLVLKDINEEQIDFVCSFTTGPLTLLYPTQEFLEQARQYPLFMERISLIRTTRDVPLIKRENENFTIEELDRQI